MQTNQAGAKPRAAPPKPPVPERTAAAGASTLTAQPLTQRLYLATVMHRQDAVGQAAGKPWVQVRRRFREGPLVLCGQVLEIQLGDHGEEWFKVATFDGPVWAESRNVRLCSGDGRCTCDCAEQPAGRPC